MNTHSAFSPCPPGSPLNGGVITVVPGRLLLLPTPAADLPPGGDWADDGPGGLRRFGPGFYAALLADMGAAVVVGLDGASQAACQQADRLLRQPVSRQTAYSGSLAAGRPPTQAACQQADRLLRPPVSRQTAYSGRLSAGRPPAQAADSGLVPAPGQPARPASKGSRARISAFPYRDPHDAGIRVAA
jgi:hypothetical protein